jgi:hypothetical protein
MQHACALWLAGGRLVVALGMVQWWCHDIWALFSFQNFSRFSITSNLTEIGIINVHWLHHRAARIASRRFFSPRVPDRGISTTE